MRPITILAVVTSLAVAGCGGQTDATPMSRSRAEAAYRRAFVARTGVHAPKTHCQRNVDRNLIGEWLCEGEGWKTETDCVRYEGIVSPGEAVEVPPSEEPVLEVPGSTGTRLAADNCEEVGHP